MVIRVLRSGLRSGDAPPVPTDQRTNGPTDQRTLDRPSVVPLVVLVHVHVLLLVLDDLEVIADALNGGVRVAIVEAWKLLA